jgi:hypothetical protein
LPGIAPVGLDAVTGLGRNERGRDYFTVKLALLQVPENDITARTGFINKTQFQIGLFQFFDELIQGLECAADLAAEIDGRVALEGGGHDD